MKKISDKKMAELQGLADEYVAKKGMSNSLSIRLLAGFVAIASAATVLTSCSSLFEPISGAPNGEDINSEYYESEYGSDRVIDTELADLEMEFEKGLAEYLSAATGVDINLIDIHEVDLVQSSGNYLVLTGEMITGVKEGNKACTVTFELSDENMELMRAALSDRVIRAVGLSKSTTSLDEDLFARKYEKDFLAKLEGVLKDENTVVSAIYDKDNKEWVFDKDEPAQSNNR